MKSEREGGATCYMFSISLVIASIISSDDTSKGACTRALWCISSQNIDKRLMSNSVS